MVYQLKHEYAPPPSLAVAKGTGDCGGDGSLEGGQARTSGVRQVQGLVGVRRDRGHAGGMVE